VRRLIPVLLLLSLALHAQDAPKPLVVFFRPALCARCDDFERSVVTHPAIQRRLPAVSFETRPADKASVALFDRAGAVRVTWPVIPDATNFGIILDSAVAVAPHFDRAMELAEAGDPHAGEVAAALGYARIWRISDAKAALARAKEHGSDEVKQAALEAEAKIDARVSFDAEVGRNPSAETRGGQVSGAIRILPLQRQVVAGRHIVRTHVATASVARVVFSLDGREIARVEQPPFAAGIEFGKVPERHSIRVIAFDHDGKEIGGDERVVNEAGELFWLRIVSPRAEFASGAVRVSMNVRVPAARRIRRVVLSWNDAERAVLTKAPWESTVRIPDAQTGVLRAVAELDDGRTSEDAVLLNAGMVEQMDVQLVELPITVISRSGTPAELTPGRITVREFVSSRASARDPLPGGDSASRGMTRLRRVESIATAAETPLTVGLLIDISSSMHSSLADVQEAAIRFLQTILGEKDRAFFVAFDHRARLLQPVTGEVEKLRDRIMSVRPEGQTALHDAMVLGLLQFEGIKGRRALVVFSDGLDENSQYGAEDVSDLARRINVPVHVIAAAGNRSLEHVALSTGATFHGLTDLGSLPGIYARIEAALRAQVLAFVRTEAGKKENEWRNIEVKVEGEGLDVYAPAGYYVQW
jgi:VWFA-related protein